MLGGESVGNEAIRWDERYRRAKVLSVKQGRTVSWVKNIGG